MRRALVIALVCACGSDARSTSSADPPPTAADPQAAEAVDARVRIERLQKDLDALDARLGDAVSALADAKSDAERADAKGRIERLQRDRTQLDLQMAQARKAYCATDPVPAGCT